MLCNGLNSIPAEQEKHLNICAIPDLGMAWRRYSSRKTRFSWGVSQIASYYLNALRCSVRTLATNCVHRQVHYPQVGQSLTNTVRNV